MASICKLTICFEDPFWIALVETQDDQEGYRVARHVFGPEPSDPEVEAFIHDNWKTLRFTESLQVEKRGGTKINPKRLRRLIEREIAANARTGTKAQQALAEQREAQKVERKAESKAQREARERALFAQKQLRRKQKHRGH